MQPPTKVLFFSWFNKKKKLNLLLFGTVCHDKMTGSVSLGCKTSELSSARQLIRSVVLDVISQLFIRVSPALARIVTAGL